MTAAPINARVSPLFKPVTTLWGVGPERGAQLRRLGISTVEDLLLHAPRRYEDRRHLSAIAELQLNEPAITSGQVVAMGLKRYRHGKKSVFELILTDGTARLHCRWWNLPFMEQYFKVGDEVVVFGKPLSLKPRTMDHPETEVIESEERLIHLQRITPVYPLTEGLPQRWLRGLVWRTLEAFESQIPEPWPAETEPGRSGAPGAASPSPSAAQGSRLIPGRARAIRMLHFPESPEEPGIARKRLALDEFTRQQLDFQLRRRKFESQARGLPCGGDNRLIKQFLARLGFKLTQGQTGVLREIRADLRGPHPMRRLLQGDVGAGKTVVAACTILMAIESGYSAALMAPTEILAEQHFANFRAWFEPLGIEVRLQTGSHKGKPDAARPKDGAPASQTPSPASRPLSARLIIGTHALIAAGFSVENLGLAIIDEQHKFGVTQREQLLRKGRYPHVLVMTATPIPRTLGLTVYGDLDISVIRELPPGRGRVKTFLRTAAHLPRVWTFIREQLARGRQAYVVYPRVEETNGNEIKAVTREFEAVGRKLAPFQAGLLHGRMSGRDKEAVMSAFRAGKLHVLVSTALIEVGLDVPNATVLLVENAEQFGLAQLHQLRGRIGRGAQDSFCILVSASSTAQARSRLETLEQTTDGFRIAEADLALRGPGELLGPEQSGIPSFRFGNLATDWDLVQQARERARRLEPLLKPIPAPGASRDR